MPQFLTALWTFIVRCLRYIVNFILWNWDDDEAAAKTTKQALQRHSKSAKTASKTNLNLLDTSQIPLTPIKSSNPSALLSPHSAIHNFHSRSAHVSNNLHRTPYQNSPSISNLDINSPSVGSVKYGDRNSNLDINSPFYVSQHNLLSPNQRNSNAGLSDYYYDSDDKNTPSLRNHPINRLKDAAIDHVFNQNNLSGSNSLNYNQPMERTNSASLNNNSMEIPIELYDNSNISWNDLSTRYNGESLLQREIHLNKWNEAHDCATHFNLHHDLIYKAQWIAFQLQEGSVHKYLAKVTDTAWVLDNCLNSILSCPSDMKTLLRYGLKLTDSISISDVENEINAIIDYCDGKNTEINKSSGNQCSISTLCFYRIKFIQYLARLETHRSIYANIYNSTTRNEFFISTFDEFKEMDLLLLATQFAVKGQYFALYHLFKRHGEEILPFMLSILSLLPNTLDPPSYRQLLPVVQPKTLIEIPMQVIPWARKDWCERDDIYEFAGIRPSKAFLLLKGKLYREKYNIYDEKMVDPESEYYSLVRYDTYYWSIIDDAEKKYLSDIKIDPLSIFSYNTVNTYGLYFQKSPLPAYSITEWYVNRALQIEEESGLVVHSADLLRIGRSNNVPNLETVYAKFKVVSLMLYECELPLAIEDEIEALSVSFLDEFSSQEVLELQFRHVKPDDVRHRMEKVLTPYIQVLVNSLKQMDKSTKEAIKIVEDIVADFVVSNANKGKLDVCIKMLECIKIANSGYDSALDTFANIDENEEYNSDDNFASNNMKLEMKVDTNRVGIDKSDLQLITLFSDYKSYCKLVLKCAYNKSNKLSDLTTLQRFVELIPGLSEQDPIMPQKGLKEQITTHALSNNDNLKKNIIYNENVDNFDQENKPIKKKKTKIIKIKKKRILLRKSDGTIIGEKPQIVAEAQLQNEAMRLSTGYNRFSDLYSLGNQENSDVNNNSFAPSFQNAFHSLQRAGNNGAAEVLGNFITMLGRGKD